MICLLTNLSHVVNKSSKVGLASHCAKCIVHKGPNNSQWTPEEFQYIHNSILKCLLQYFHWFPLKWSSMLIIDGNRGFTMNPVSCGMVKKYSGYCVSFCENHSQKMLNMSRLLQCTLKSLCMCFWLSLPCFTCFIFFYWHYKYATIVRIKAHSRTFFFAHLCSGKFWLLACEVKLDTTTALHYLFYRLSKLN